MDPTRDLPQQPDQPDQGDGSRDSAAPSPLPEILTGSEILRQLDALDARLRRIERGLGYLSPVRPSQAARGLFPQPEGPRRSESASASGGADPVAFADSTSTTSSDAPRIPAARLRSLLSPKPPPPAPLPSRAPKGSSPPNPPPARNLEQLFGERIIAWVGAIIVVIGAALFVKLAYDQKWFTLAPWMRCVAGGLFGAALVFAGEFLRRRVSPLAGAGSLAAGIGTMYASAFAAYELYEILGLGATYALLAAISALGVVLAIVSRLASVAIVAMLGAYLVPILLWSGTRETLLLPGHLLFVQAGACVLASRLGGRFNALRALSTAATLLLGSLWTLSRADQPLIAPLGYLGLTWLLVHTDLLLLARRARPATDALQGAAHLSRLLSGHLPVGLTLGFTAWAATLGIILVRAAHPEADWLVPAALSAASLAGACVALRMVDRSVPLPSMKERLKPPLSSPGTVALVLLAECGILVLLTLGVALDGPARALSFLGIAVAAAVVARSIRDPRLTFYAIVASILAATDLVTSETAFIQESISGSDRLGLVLTTWSWCMGAVALGMLAIGRLSFHHARTLAQFASGLGLFVLCLSFVHEDVRGTSLAWVWLIIASLTMAARPLIGRPLTIATPPIIAGLSMLIWAFRYVEHAGTGIPHPLVHGLLLGLSIAMLFAIAARRSTAPAPWVSPRQLPAIACWVAAALAFLMATSFEVARLAALFSGDERARAAAVSVWWAVCSVLGIALGFARSLAPLRRTGLGLLYAAGIKIVVIDFATVSAGGRVVAFIGVGVLMLLVGVVYARVSKRLSPPPPPPHAPPEVPPHDSSQSSEPAS